MRSLRDGWIFLVLIAFLCLIGCASIIKGGEQSVTIKSTPSGAILKVYDIRTDSQISTGATPQTISLKRGAGYFKKGKYRIVAEKEGVGKKEFILEGSPNGWYIGGNLIFGGLIGWLIVDPLTGAMWTLEPEEVNIDIKGSTSSLLQDRKLTIALTTMLPAHYLQNMKPIKINQ